MAASLGERVMSVLAQAGVPVYSLAVHKRPMNLVPRDLPGYEEIFDTVIVRKIHAVLEYIG